MYNIPVKQKKKGGILLLMIPNIAPNSYGIPTIYVHDHPFLILGGELHNSNCSSPVYMEEQVWPALD